MSTLDRLKLDLKKMIADNLGNVLKKLDQVLDDKRTDCYNNFIMLTAAFKQWDTRQIQSIHPTEINNVELSNLTHRLLRFIDGLEEGDIRQTFYLQEEIYEKILVVCKLPERVAYMRKFFPDTFFKNVVYAEPVGVPHTADEYDIVLFDNKPTDSDGGEHALLKHYLQQETVVLYFGANLPLLYDEKYAEKVYSTNFVFSLHARIFELINYLKYTRANEDRKIGG